MVHGTDTWYMAKAIYICICMCCVVKIKQKTQRLLVEFSYSFNT